LLARAWAGAFCVAVEQKVSEGSMGGLESFITVDLLQADPLLPGRTQSVGLYMLVGAGALLALSALAILVVRLR